MTNNIEGYTLQIQAEQVYTSGRFAAFDGKPKGACPWDKDSLIFRACWLAGWEDRTNEEPKR